MLPILIKYEFDNGGIAYPDKTKAVGLDYNKWLTKDALSLEVLVVVFLFGN